MSRRLFGTDGVRGIANVEPMTSETAMGILGRFLVPAGLTGLWQVSARAHSTFGEALDLDVLYAQSWSIGLDLALLARTPLQVLRAGATA